jgi:pimeloyl-ACP methyl ester carboxylesterase
VREVLVDGLRIAYLDAGAGPPLVLLHGGMDDSRSWRWQVDGLTDEFRVLAWDAPGCGQSSEPPESWRMPEYADCLKAWLDTVGVQRPNVLGLSWGSAIALELYRRHPSVPRSLVLASAYAGWAGSIPPEEVAARLESVLPGADLPREELLKGWPGLPSTAAPPELVEELASIWADNAGSVLDIPVLLLYGDLDQRSPLRIARELRDRIPAARLAVIPGTGHVSNAEAPSDFNAHVREFLRSLGPAT